VPAAEYAVRAAATSAPPSTRRPHVARASGWWWRSTGAGASWRRCRERRRRRRAAADDSSPAADPVAMGAPVEVQVQVLDEVARAEACARREVEPVKRCRYGSSLITRQTGQARGRGGSGGGVGRKVGGRLDGGVGRPKPLPTTAWMKPVGGSVEEEPKRGAERGAVAIEGWRRLEGEATRRMVMI
jgi:hypothetical protein